MAAPGPVITSILMPTEKKEGKEIFPSGLFSDITQITFSLSARLTHVAIPGYKKARNVAFISDVHVPC